MKIKGIKSTLVVLVAIVAIFIYVPPKAEAAVSAPVCHSFYDSSRNNDLTTVLGLFGPTFNGYSTNVAYNAANSASYTAFTSFCR